MIQEMVRLGAAVAQMDEMVGNPAALPPAMPGDIALVVSEIAKPHSLVVDQSGERYTNEAQSYMAFCQDMLARHSFAPAVPSWLIFDSQYMAKYMIAGTLPGSRKPQDWYGSGWLKKAASMTELAEKLGISAEQLVATIERFNGFCRTGKDLDFNRGGKAFDRFLGDRTHWPSPSLGAVVKPPFYAYPFYPGDVGTYGGVVTDSHARVVREDGSPIPGLYATGTTTASVMGRAYPGAGCSIGPSFTWGFVAAIHAVQTSGSWQEESVSVSQDLSARSIGRRP